MLPVLDITGNLTTNPDLRFSPSGTAIANVHIAANDSKRNQSGEWETVRSLFLGATAFNEAAETLGNAVKGQRVRLIGRLQTEEWADKQTGEKRSAIKLLVDFVSVYPPRQQGGAPQQHGGVQQGGWGDPNGAEPPF